MAIRKLRKIRMPDEDMEKVWDKMTKVERQWYEDFKRATEYHNWGALKHVALMAPGSDYVRLYEEIAYESHAPERGRYETPKSRHPKYSEWDYGWSAPKKNPTNRRREIDKNYEQMINDDNMGWAK